MNENINVSRDKLLEKLEELLKVIEKSHKSKEQDDVLNTFIALGGLVTICDLFEIDLHSVLNEIGLSLQELVL